MSEYVVALNHWGENFVGFAWPMLWQSSLLIAVVFAFDLFFARRIRASVRYALWVVVLVKLILPPALALPTGATWWLWRTHPVVEPPVFQNYTVSFDDTVPNNLVAPTVPMALPLPNLGAEAWVLLAAITTAAGLLSWLLFRWLRVAANVRRAASARADLDGILEEARQLAGLRRLPRLKLIDDAQSPAVYGLLRPVILLPRALAAKLSVRQLRAVLLHEAVHLQRGDVWVNCAQTLLQIAYWWHPLLWLANARIRRLREEAVDDAVMLALRDGADAYAPTLLEVAKYAFRRPLASLGLVGILESRSALRQRVERLVDFRPPRKAGVTFLSLCGIFAFSAMALPMGQGPDLPVATSQMTNNLELSLPSGNPPGAKDKPKINRITINASGQIFLNDEPVTMPLLRERLEAIKSADPDPGVVVKAADNVAYKSVVNVLETLRQLNIKKVGLRTEADPLDVEENDHRVHVVSTTAGPRFDVEHYQVLGNTVLAPGTIDAVITNIDGALGTNVSFEGAKMVVERLQQEYHDRGYVTARVILLRQTITNATLKVQVFEGPYSDPDRNAIYHKLNNIQLDQIVYQSLPLSEVLRQLREESLRRDPERKGINFMFNPNITSINPVTGLPVKANATAQSVDPSEINITLNLKNVSLKDLLNGICLASDQPIKYSVENYGVVFSPKDTNSVQYEMRTFKINTGKFYSSLTNSMRGLFPNSQTQDIGTLAREFFSSLGVNLDSPKNVFYNDRLGVLFVYATPQDLDIIEKAMQILSDDPPMLHINARFIEVPRTFFSSAAVKFSFRGLTNGWVLPNADFRVLLHEIESQGGSEELAEPEATTLSGRQTQMRATIIQSIVTNFSYEASTGPASATARYGKVSEGSRLPKSMQVETGPIFDVVPNVLADGYTIRLQVKTSDIDFLGYAKSKGYSTNIADLAAFGAVSPIFQIRQASMNKLIYDGQTLVIFPKSETAVSHVWDEKDKKQVLMPVERLKEEDDKVEIVFATATLIDAAGNRSHSDGEMAFAQTDVPPDQFPSSGGIPWSEQ